MVRHYVNKEKRMVIAVAEDCELDAVIRILKRMQGTVSIDDNLLRTATMHNKYVAVARCHPNDVFDEAEGRRIADERLNEKLEAARTRAVNRWKKHHLAMMDRL